MEKYTTQALVSAEKAIILNEKDQIEAKKIIIDQNYYAVCDLLEQLKHRIEING